MLFTLFPSPPISRYKGTFNVLFVTLLVWSNSYLSTTNVLPTFLITLNELLFTLLDAYIALSKFTPSISFVFS